MKPKLEIGWTDFDKILGAGSLIVLDDRKNTKNVEKDFPA